MDRVVLVAGIGLVLGLVLAVLTDQWWLVPATEVGFAGAALGWERHRGVRWGP